MQEVQQQISLYHMLFYACLVSSVFWFLLSVVFFFKFDIPNIFDMRTGRSVKKTIQRMEEMNARTGQFCSVPGRENTESLICPDNSAKNGDITEVLDDGKRKQTELEEVQEEVDESFGMFRIEKYMLFIHTDEIF